jgi:hypothetical protein
MRRRNRGQCLRGGWRGVPGLWRERAAGVRGRVLFAGLDQRPITRRVERSVAKRSDACRSGLFPGVRAARSVLLLGDAACLRDGRPWLSALQLHARLPLRLGDAALTNADESRRRLEPLRRTNDEVHMILLAHRLRERAVNPSRSYRCSARACSESTSRSTARHPLSLATSKARRSKARPTPRPRCAGTT